MTSKPQAVLVLEVDTRGQPHVSLMLDKRELGTAVRLRVLSGAAKLIDVAEADVTLPLSVLARLYAQGAGKP